MYDLTSVIHPYIVRDYRFSLPAFSRKGGSFDCHTNCSNNVIARIAWIRKFISSALCILILSRRNNAVARRDNTVSRVSPVFCCATVDCRWWLSCMMRAYYISIWPVHAGLPKSQVSSLKSQVSSPSGLPKSQVSSLKYLSLFVTFISFKDKTTSVCCTSNYY